MTTAAPETLQLFGMEMVETETEICTKCGMEKPLRDFKIRYKTTKEESTSVYECKDCANKEERLRYRLNKQHKHLNTGRCEKCGKKERLVLDHDHKTGKFRGYLCNACNVGIARLGDTKEGAQEAVDYFEMVEKRQQESIYI